MRIRLSALLLALCAAATLEAKEAPADFHFAILGDRKGGHVEGVYEGIVAEVSRLEPALAITVGDQIEGYTEDAAVLERQWDEYLAIVGTVGFPLYITPGNHDITTDGQLAAWKRRTGREPCYSFDYEGVHFVVLDTSRWDTSEEWLAKSGHREWLERDLTTHAEAPLTVLLYHKPYWFDTLGNGKNDGMHELFRRHGVDAVFNGHYHHYAASTYDGISYCVVGSSGGDIGEEDEAVGAVFQYVWATVRDGKLRWTVFRRGSALAADFVTVTDVKFAERVTSELVSLRPLRLPADETEKAPITCRPELVNPTAGSIAIPVTWDVPPNWSVSPATAEVTLAAGARAETVFEATPKGGLYPLPALAASFPYREGKVFRARHRLPVCRTQRVTRFEGPPVLDGDLGDEVWKKAAMATYFCAQDGAECKTDPTVFSFGRDGDFLYVGARCDQEDMSKLVTRAAARDGAVFGDDCVGLFLLPGKEGNEFYQVYVSAAGVVMDIRDTCHAPGQVKQDRAWNADVRVAAKKGDRRWTVEIAVPFAALGAGAAPRKGTLWRANFRRKEIHKDACADWQFPIGFEPRLFGYLQFE